MSFQITAAVLPQEHTGKNKALLAVPAHCQRQEHQGSREPSIRASHIASFFAVLHIKGCPSWNSALRRRRTIRTRAESTTRVRPQEHVDKNKAPSTQAGGSQRQEQEGSRRPSHHVPDIFILVMNPFRSSSEGVPKQDPNPKRLRTESTLAENRVVLI